jgi:hypothetical protein
MALARQEFERTVFAMPRASQYFDARQLTTLTGQPEWNFAVVLEKELADNALDAAESAGRQPELSLDIITGDDEITITVTDSGPGIPPEIIPKILDFENLASDKAAYRSPTRGAQGNALKTVLGIPHALGGSAPVIIEACGVRHQIRAWLDPASHVRTEHIPQDCDRQSGTCVTVTIPAKRQDFDPLDQARAVALFNPHAFVQIGVSGLAIEQANGDGASSAKMREMYKSLVDYPRAWRKWLPQMAIPAAWYDEPSLHRLISLHNGRSRRQLGRDLPLGEFVRQFRGLRRTAKAREITALVPEIRRLSDFEGREDEIARLLRAMQVNSQPVEAKALGVIGADQFRSRFEEWYGVERFWYAKRLEDSGPYVLEVALAETKEERGARHHYFGLNFSPTFGDPLKKYSFEWDENSEMESWGGLDGLLSQAHAGQFPHVFAFHLTAPSFAFGDYSKSTIELDPEMRRAVAGALADVLKVFRREGERNRRDANRALRAERDREKEQRAAEWNVKDAVFAVLKEAHAKAIDYAGRKVSVRQLYYQVREMIQQYTSKELKFDYFSQDLLTEWRDTHGPLEGLYNDPRGMLYEPHTGNSVPVGTLQVADYEFPEYVFNKILYIEKKGLMPVLRSVELMERFDLSIVAGEGYATEAIRTLFERAEKGSYRLFVLHDADPYGYEIARTLTKETRRMPGYSVEVVDLGLKLEEALAMGLSTEKFIRQKALPAELELTDIERKYFEGEYKGRNAKGKQQWECERVELNALAPPALVAFLERKLKEADANDKVIPPAKYLAAHGRMVYAQQIETLVKSKTLEWLNIPRIARELATQFERLIGRITPITPTALAKAFARDPALSWREVVAGDLGGGIEKHQDAIEEELRQALKRQVQNLLKKGR